MTHDTISSQTLNLHTILQGPKKRHVLIVEDTAVCRSMLKRVLISLNYTCDEAEDGEIAVEKVRRSLGQALIQAQAQAQAQGHSQHGSQRISGLNSARQGSIRQLNSARQSFLSPRSTPRQNYPTGPSGIAAGVSVSAGLTSSPTTPTAAGAGAGAGNNAMVATGASTPALPLPIVKQYDLILCDNIMPNMCGPEAVALMRKIGYRGPIFGVTGIDNVYNQ